MSILNNHNFTIVDLETTGGSPLFNRIIEVGLLRVKNGVVVEQYQTLINPEVKIPEFITKITGLTSQDLVSQPKFADIAEELLPKFKDSIFVAHNVAFDYGFLQEEYRRLGYKFKSERLCTVRLSRNLYSKEKHHNLSTIIERFGLEITNRHRAFDDASILWDFLQLTQDEFDSQTFEQALQKSTTFLKI